MSDIIDVLHDPEVKRFEVKDLDTANWAVGKMLKAHQRIAIRAAQAAEYKARIDSWLQEANREDVATCDFFEHELRPFVEKEIAGGKKKSVKLLYGTAGFRSSPASVQIDDEDAAIDYCEKFAPELIRVKKSLDRVELRKRIDKGEVFDGVRMEPGHVRFYVNIEEDADE